MCMTCGCSKGQTSIEGHEQEDRHTHHEHEYDPLHTDHDRPQVIHHHYHHQGDVHHHYHIYESGTQCCCVDDHSATVPLSFEPKENDQGDLHYGQGEAQTHAPGMTQKRMLEIELSVLDKNNHIAAHNREHFKKQNLLVLNLVSSPGSGKTTLLTETLMLIKNDIPCAVIEGDQQTSNDADRIRATGVSAIQVNTGKGCHLDAQMVHDATHRLSLKDHGILFIENVGNLVCPAGFDLGEKAKVAVLSVTEGQDKPLKYPHMFAAAKIMLINKVDLLPYVEFDVDACIANARSINPEIEAIQISATTGQGMDKWLEWLKNQAKIV